MTLLALSATDSPPRSRPVRVLILDDHELLRLGLRALMETTGEIVLVGEAATAEEALAQIPVTQPQVALLDVRLEHGSGIDVCRQIRSRHPEVRCLMLTSFTDDETLFSAILAGASGYVLKQVGAADLVQAILVVAEGKSLLDPIMTERALERIRGRARDEEHLAKLSTQEQRILDLIGEGCTNREIGEALYLSEKTVKNYVTSLLSKLGMRRRTEAAAYSARLSQNPERALEAG
jgi:DNA-binding NarL/FixJ family response regulator